MTRVVIAGGGLAGSFAAIALASLRPEAEVILVEEGNSFGGKHTWSFFDSDIAKEARWLIDLVGVRHWPDHEVRFPRRKRTLPLGYNSIRSKDLDIAVRASVPNAGLLTGSRIAELFAHSAILATGEAINADCVIDARGPVDAPRLELGWQKFLGQHCRFDEPHGIERPVIMDATVGQHDGFRFLYLLPFSETELLIEDTYYSPSPALDRELLRSRITEVAPENARRGLTILDEEEGVLPIVIAGALEELWPEANTVPRLGLRGGFFHPTTGYSLSDALLNASLIAQADELSSSAVASLLRRRSARLWKTRRFYQLLNRLLFRATEPGEEYRVLEHFYRLPASRIARFYAGQLTPFDKFKILSGRPPVRLGRAIHSLWGRS